MSGYEKKTKSSKRHQGKHTIVSCLHSSSPLSILLPLFQSVPNPPPPPPLRHPFLGLMIPSSERSISSRAAPPPPPPLLVLDLSGCTVGSKHKSAARTDQLSPPQPILPLIAPKALLSRRILFIRTDLVLDLYSLPREIYYSLSRMVVRSLIV